MKRMQNQYHGSIFLDTYCKCGKKYLWFMSTLQKNGPITKLDISLITNLKLTTLIRIMQPLVDSGLVVESKIGESTGGRKPVLYDVNTNRFYIIGIDISRTYTQIVVTN